MSYHGRSVRASLTAAERARLAAILSRLESDHAGERDAAGLAAVRMMKAKGLRLADVIAPEPPRLEQRSDGPQDCSSNPDEWRAAAAACLRYADWLTGWEKDFLTNIRDRQHLTPKQAACLAGIARKVCAEGGSVP
jgi:hypothetical protein